MLMTNEKTPNGKATHKPQGLRDSIVMRLKAHDAAVRATLSDEAKPKTDTKDA
ncbi:MAG: hypothetical protein KC448_11675 [Yoonia sp.]|nr:hypothetical protein [Yoonia sp.]